MKLADFVKGLKVGGHLRLETADENCRDVIIWRAPVTGEYYFASFNAHYGDVETPEELLNYILENYGGKWLEYDFEVYKSREELKSEVKQLEKALKSACEIIEDGEMCSVCPANNFCFHSDRTCAEDIFDKLMKEAAK